MKLFPLLYQIHKKDHPAAGFPAAWPSTCGYDGIIPRITCFERGRRLGRPLPRENSFLSERILLVNRCCDFLDSVMRKGESRFLIRVQPGNFRRGLTKASKSARETARDHWLDPMLTLHSKALTVAPEAIPELQSQTFCQRVTRTWLRTCSMKMSIPKKSKAPQPAERLACFRGERKPQGVPAPIQICVSQFLRVPGSTPARF